MNTQKTIYSARQGIWWNISDVIAMTKRNLLRYVRLPQLLVFSTIQPIMFLLLFTYVFGGAIKTPGLKYMNYLIPGIIVQAVIFGSVQTGVGLAEDFSKGLIDRFRSLPMSRSAVLLGRTISDTIRNVFVILLMTGVGALIGFRFTEGVGYALLALALTVLFGFAFSWISATIGMLVQNVEAAQVAGFIWIFPLVFASSIFVPIDTMPPWLKTFAEASPITVTVDTVRALLRGGEFVPSLAQSLAWIVWITAVFSFLSVTIYRRSE